MVVLITLMQDYLQRQDYLQQDFDSLFLFFLNIQYLLKLVCSGGLDHHHFRSPITLGFVKAMHLRVFFFFLP